MIKFFVYRTSSSSYAGGWIESFDSMEELLNWVEATKCEVIITDNYYYQKDPNDYNISAELTTIKYALEIYDTYRE